MAAYLVQIYAEFCPTPPRYLSSLRSNRLGSTYAPNAPHTNLTNAVVILTGGVPFAGAEGSLCYGV